MLLNYTKLHKNALLNPHAHSTDAGLDLVSVEEIVLKSGVPTKIGTGISVQIPGGCVGLIWDKSSIGSMGLKVLGGVIDSGYRGEVIVVLINLTNEEIILPAQKKIAQLIIQRYESAEPVLVDSLDDSTRGGDGFGSTGK